MVKSLVILALSVFAAVHNLYAQDTLQSAATQPITEAQVFEWWDDGIITPEEADEIFSRLEEQNYDEACLLAEVYAQEPCATPKKKQAKPRTKKKSQPPPKVAKDTVSIIPHGHLAWKAQYDSDGHLKKLRKELQVRFYYFRFRMGSQELLSYRRDGLEAHFGQVSTLEIHSHLPLDTLWGAALLYPIGKFRLGALLDSSKTIHTRISFLPNRQNEITASFWKLPSQSAIDLQARTTLGQISAWYQIGQDMPLFKIQLQSEMKHLSWKTTAYLHGDPVPQGLNLSKGIVENWLWASQTFNFHWQDDFNTVLSAKARLLSPVGSDSVSARFKASLTSGPDRLRPSLSITCVEASDNCNTTEWKPSIESSWERVTLNASAKFRHDDKTKPPKIELAASYRPSQNAFVKILFALPNGNPVNAISFQNELKLDSDWLGCDLVFAFKKTKKSHFQPNFAHLQASLKF